MVQRRYYLQIVMISRIWGWWMISTHLNYIKHQPVIIRALWFPNVENVDRIAKSIHRNGIYGITWYVTDFVNVWMNGLVSVNIKRQNDYLNMNPACSACLCVNTWRRCADLFTTQILKHVTLAVISASGISLKEDINTWTSSELLRKYFMIILPFNLSKTNS